ncbi:unnamed protein product [Penicillium pancosmium]
MDFLNAYFLSSPASVVVALLTAAFLFNEAWPRLSRRKKTYKLSNEPLAKSGSGSGLSVIKEPEVPEGWLIGRDVFELERRGLFSKSWLYLAHRTQLTKPGAYQSFDLAGFPVFLIRGKDNQIRAFHNVCRHRAYTITRKETGASTVLGCRYHGWSYDTTGKLVKAPQFEDVPGFEKSENSLFEIHTRTTDSGHVFVNLNAGDASAFENSTLSALDAFSDAAVLRSSEWVTGQTLTANFNWKLGPSERRHTALAEQLEERVSEAVTSSLLTKIVKIAKQTNKKADLSLFPTSETSTHVRYDLFDCAPKMTTDEGALARAIEEPIQDFVKGIEAEYRSVASEPTDISPAMREILGCVQEHAKLERARGGQILPAMHQPKGSSLFQQAEQRM